jgi:mannose-1-phosphate guanylyltransferase
MRGGTSHDSDEPTGVAVSLALDLGWNRHGGCSGLSAAELASTNRPLGGVMTIESSRMRLCRSPDFWALVLAGGDGTRLRDVTTQIAGRPIPKQYCRILGDRSMLETTLARVSPLVPHKRTLVIINQDHLEMACPQVSGLPTTSVLVQPQNRDTGPGLLLSLLEIADRDPSARVAVLPSDHYFENDEALRAHLARADEIVARNPRMIVLLGMQPDLPDTGYGYVEPAAPLRSGDRMDAFHVAAFREKPTLALARRIVARGALWNSFVMVFEVGRVLDLLRTIRPADFDHMLRCRRDDTIDSHGYADLPRWNFSHDFLQQIPQHLIVLRVEGTHWSDWGTPQAIERTFARLRRIPPWRAGHHAQAFS